MPVLSAFRKRLDPRRFNGATLLGLRGIVVKSHGSADVFGFERAIERAMEEVRNEVLHRLMRRFGQGERGNAGAGETVTRRASFAPGRICPPRSGPKHTLPNARTPR